MDNHIKSPNFAGSFLVVEDLALINMGGRYHQKYKNFNRSKQNRIVLLIVYKIAHSISKCSTYILNRVN